MEDSSEDLPTPPRRTAARPFFSPRPSGEGVTGPLELRSRRAAQLFTPPGSSPATARADTETVVQPATALPDARDGGGDWRTAATVDHERSLDADALMAHRNTLEDGAQLIVEQFEPEEIELTSPAASSHPDEHAIEVIAYDDANSGLQAATGDGARAHVDDLRIESTEVSFQETGSSRLDVETFWASEPFAAAEPAADAPAADAPAADAPAADAPAAEQPAVPAHDEPMFADSTPPWVGRETPVSTPTLEELKESEPWTLPSSFEASIMDDASFGGVPTFDESVREEPAADAQVLNARPTHDVADALERIAARVRAGEIALPADSESSDAAALAAVLTAMLRLPR